MNFGSFLGNEAIRKSLTRFSHAFLIEGEEGSGRHTLAEQLCRALLCPADDPPCGECPHCRKLAAGSHPDRIDVPPDCKPEQLREILSDLWLLPSEAERRVYVLDNAGEMNETLQNILLKSIEEPPDHAVFLLISSPSQPLLATVRSRCQVLTTEPLSDELLAPALKEEFGPEAPIEEAIRFSGGYLGRAKQYLSGAYTQQLQRCRQVEQALERGDGAELVALCRFADRGELADFCGMLGQYYRKRLIEEVRQGRDLGISAAVCRALDRLEPEVRQNINVNLWTVNLLRGLRNAYDTQKKGNGQK